MNFNAPTCYTFTDYIQICTISVMGELVSIEGTRLDPVTHESEPEYFETSFDFFYDILGKMCAFDDGQHEIETRMMEVLADAVANGSEETINMGEDILQLWGFVFRLVPLISTHEDGSVEQAGYYIQDAVPELGGIYGVEDYVSVRDFGNPSPEIDAQSASISGHLANLALRYAYYCGQREKHMPKEEALQYSCLTDTVVFAAARAAYAIVNPDAEEGG